MTQWNPNSGDNCVRGLEWHPDRQVDRRVAATGEQSYSWKLDSSASETIDRLWTFSDGETLNAYDLIDIYEADSLKPVPIHIRQRFYATDAAYGQVNPLGALWYQYSVSPSAFRMQNVNLDFMTTATTSFVSLVNDDPIVPGEYRGDTTVTFIVPIDFVSFNDRVQVPNRQFIGLPSVPEPLSLDTPLTNFYTYNAIDARWSFHVDALHLIPAGHRILGLRVSGLCQRIIDPSKIGSEGDQPYRVRPALVMGPSAQRTTFYGQVANMPDQAETISYTWFRNPFTGLAWTTADLQGFNQTLQQSAVSWFMSRPDNPKVIESAAGAIFQATAEVITVEDTRVAQALRDRPRQFSGWNKWNVTKIGGGAWDTKASGTTYLFNAAFFEQQAVDRRPRISGQGINVRSLGGAEAMPNAPTEVSPEFFGDIPRAMGEELPFSPAVVLQRSNNAISVDSQPYAIAEDFSALGYISGTRGQFLGQTLTFDADNGQPDKIVFLAKSEDDRTPSAPLNIIIRSDTDEEAIASVPASSLEFPAKWQRFEIDLEAGQDGWVSGSELHEIWFSSDGDIGWHIQSLSNGAEDTSLNQPSHTFNGATFEGVTGYAFGGNPLIARDDADVCVFVGISPDAPSGFAGEFGSEGCVSGVVLTWDPYEYTDCAPSGTLVIQRKKLDSSWEDIFLVTNPSQTVLAVDVEVRRNSLNTYRAKFISSTTLSSVWTDEVEVLAVDECTGYTFTSNHEPEMALWYDDIGSRQYDFLENMSFYEFENKDGASVSRGLTDLLDEFSTDLAVALRGSHGGTPDSDSLQVDPGRRLFEPLTVMAGNKRDKDTGILYRLPYICVADSDGNRWFAVIRTPSGTRVEPGGRHLLNITVREVTSSASVVTLSEAEEVAPEAPELPELPEIPVS